MNFKKGFVQPIVVSLLGVLSATGVGVSSVVPEAYAPGPEVVQALESEKRDFDRMRGVVDGLTREERAQKIDAYFAQWNLPLAGYGEVLVQEADKYGHLDWRLVAAIAMRESTGCKFAFAENNCFGWGNKVKFSSLEIAIAEITKNLAGADEDTDHYYAGKDTKGILARYNSVIPTYTKEIFAIMDDISSMPVGPYDHLAQN